MGHAWNCVKFYGDVDQEGQQKTYTVDLMHEVRLTCDERVVWTRKDLSREFVGPGYRLERLLVRGLV